jgi:hypothetical protein
MKIAKSQSDVQDRETAKRASTRLHTAWSVCIMSFESKLALRFRDLGVASMVAAYHLMWSLYGCWLPNDPRGSSSHEMRNPVLVELGELHQGRKKVQPCRADLRAFYHKAEPLLMYPVLHIGEVELAVVAQAFATTIKCHRYTCYGCAIMFDHVHMLIRKHRNLAEEMIFNFQDESRTRLIDARCRSADHPTWGGPGWKVYLDSCDDIERVVRYIADNPIKAGRPEQEWPFVQAYDGWLPGIGARRKAR